MAPRRSVDLAASLSDIARTLLAAQDVHDTLHRIVFETLRLIEPAEHAGVDVVTGHSIDAVAPSSTTAQRVDEIQVDTGQGPCLDALREHEVFRTGDLPAEERWPRFASIAFHETGVRSVLGVRLWVEGDTLGALNIYSTAADAFDDYNQDVASVLAAHAAVAWTTARQQEQMEAALSTRDLIGQAKGMLMLTHGIDADEAFDLLRTASQRDNTKLRDLAQRIVSGDDIVTGEA
jgi:GAF domain-containing protein